MPELSPQEAEELFQLYTAANNAVGITPKEARKLLNEFRERLQKIWNAEPRPIPLVFDDFRQAVVEQFSPKNHTPVSALRPGLVQSTVAPPRRSLE